MAGGVPQAKLSDQEQKSKMRQLQGSTISMREHFPFVVNVCPATFLLWRCQWSILARATCAIH